MSLSQALYALPLRLAALFPPAAPGAWQSRLGWVAVGVACAGLAVESVADEQKLRAKRAAPTEPVMTGLYRFCRHPNYFGEVLFHIGVAGLAANGTGLQFAAAAVAPLYMVAVMLGACKRLDDKGATKYKDHAAHKQWARATPSLVPFVSMG